MSRLRSVCLLTSLTLLSAVAMAGAAIAATEVEAADPAATPIDPRIKKALEAENLEFEVDAKGDAKVVLRFTDDNDRTQLVIVQTGTYTYRNTEFRDVFSAGLKADEGAGKGLDLPLARRLLEQSSRSKLGFWGIEDGVVWSIARIPANATASALKEAIDFVAVSADDLEKERLGTDEF